MDIPTIQPPKLLPGDAISIIAPAGTIEGHGDGLEGFQRGIAVLERMGFNVRFSERIFHSSRYLAGEDSERAEELMSAFEDPAIRAVISLRGGYGCARLIPLLAEKRLRPHPKLFMGYSDLTTLHMFFRRRFGWITVHGPMAATIGKITAAQERHLLSMLTDPDYRPVLAFDQMETWIPGRAEGVLAGGCLSIIEAGIGTAYELDTKGKILFLEDLGEPPYKLDRMLTHLRLAGKLKSVAGVLLGTFIDCEPTQGNYTAKETLRDVLTRFEVPTLFGFPAGHGQENFALPLGARIRMDADAHTIEFLDAAVS